MKLGTSIESGPTIQHMVDAARLAEDLGYDSGWSSQLPHLRDTMTVLAAVAQHTTKLRLGTAILPIYQRHPTQMAQAALTLDELSNQRFNLGIGISHKVVVENMWGLKIEEPVRAMREYLTILRDTITTGSANLDGRFFTAHSAYAPPRNEHLPIFLAALGDRMLQLAGELADGVALWMCSPDYIKTTVVPNVAAGRQKAGKSLEGFEIMAAVPVALADDLAIAKDAFRKVVQRYAGLPFYKKMLDASGFAEDLADGNVSDRALAELGGIGDQTAIKNILDRYQDAGTTLASLSPQPKSNGFEATLKAAIA